MWEKFLSLSPESRFWIVVAGIVLFVWWFFALMPTMNSYSVVGEINAFPPGAASKNYRLPADIHVGSVSTGFGTKHKYTIYAAMWPDEELLEFKGDCIAYEGEQGYCESTEGTHYYIDIHEPIPEDPDAGEDY